MSLTSEMHGLAEGLLESYDKRIAAVMTIRGSAAEDLEEYGELRQHVAAEQRQKLTEYVGSLRDNTAKTLTTLDTAHEKMAAEQRRKLTEDVGNLRDKVTGMLQALDTAHENMATDLRRHLAGGREQLATDVERMRGMMHDDYVGARKTLKSFNATMREHRIRGGSATPAHKTSAAPPAVERASAPDDLTTISGIGVSRQRLLNQAGIRTFAQLAHRSPDELMAVLGSSAHLANVKQWIAEAKLKM